MTKTSAADDPPRLDARGQITLPLDGCEFGLRPSRKAIEAIEAKVRPLTALVADGARGDISNADMATITVELMRAYGQAHPDDPLITTYREAQPERIRDLIYEAGAPRILTRLLAVMIGALNGGYTAEGEAKAVATQ